MSGGGDKSLVILSGEIRTPPMSVEARREAGFLLRRLQHGERLGLPHSRPMPSAGPRCHELRINDENKTWRIVYRLDKNEILIVELFSKTTRATPKDAIATCRQRLRTWDAE